MKVPVLLPKALNYPLTYLADSNKDFKIGDIVEVPFGTKKEIGVVWSKIQETNKKFTLRKIEKKFTGFTLGKKIVDYIEWFSMYNVIPLGKTLKMCLGNENNLIKVNKTFKLDKHIKKKKYQLNIDQKKSSQFLKKLGEKFSVSVLQGVTGSGKTLVYFERIKEILTKDKQVLVMLPEIFLTNQFSERFLDYFGFNPTVWHSKITPKNKRNIWQGIIKNKLKLIIGARSSLVLPYKNLGLIIVDEEHDPSYKQDEGVIYNARDMAIARASFENIPITLVSSIPSLETFNNIKNKKYEHTMINKRFNDISLPDTKIINLNLQKLKKKFISQEAIKIANEYLKKNEQVLFFLNRRGYAPFLVCKKCGFKHSCPNCSIYLTFHKALNKLICHHCGFKKISERKCIDKNDCDFSMYGPGVEKVYEELKIIFPNKNIKIFSSDYLKKKKNSENILDQISKNEINIIVGTQMISKGFNFPKLNCIVVVDADFSGKGYDLRTTERNIQLYNQLSGRAGRFSKKSIIIYQTIDPENLILKDIIKNNPEKFLIKELEIRKLNKLPPFQRFIAIIVSSKLKENSFRGAQEISNNLLKLKEFDVLGPVDAPIFRVKNKFRTRLLLRCNNRPLVQKKLIKALDNLKISSKIKLTVDVDPINFN